MDQLTQGLARATGHMTETITIESEESAVQEFVIPTYMEVTIRKLRAKKFEKIFEQLDELIQRGVVRLTDEAGNLILGAKGALSEFRDERMILRGGEPVLEMLAIISGLPRRHIDHLDGLDLAKILGASWKVNAHFFDQNQMELKQALGPIWDLVASLMASNKKSSSPNESSLDSSTSSSVEATELSTTS